MSVLGVNPHCIPCESCDHWIEIVIRDEHNQPFPNIAGELIDGCGARYPITIGEAPVLLTKLAPGRVTIHLESQTWLKEAQARLPFEGEEADRPVNIWLAENPTGYRETKRTAHTLTVGDMLTPDEDQDLPKRHQNGQRGVVKLVTDNSHLVTIQGCRYITLRLGMFFDGTANNSYSAKWGKQQLENRYIKWSSAYMASEYIMKNRGIHRKLNATELIDLCFNWGEISGSAANEITNIQKLFDLYQKDKFNDTQTTYSHAQYITGIGTGNSTAIAPADEDEMSGQAFGMGKYGVTAKVETGIEQICEELREITSIIRKQMMVDGFNKIEFDVFGFSRGAAAARHFINTVLEGEESLFARRFKKSCQEEGIMLSAGFDWHSNDYCEVMFAGLFDTVAAIINLTKLDISPHNNDNDPVRLWLDPQRVRKAVHLVADPKTEYRLNFSLNRLNPAPNFDELVLPGAHSDIGGGYHSRIAFSRPDYLLPLLENKLIKRVHKRNVSWFAKKRTIQTLKEKLHQAKEFEVKYGGWQESDFVLSKVNVTGSTRDRDNEDIDMHLLYRKCTEGDLSRLYLRIMYGLAEYAGVPVTETPIPEAGVVWKTRKGDNSLYYPVPDTLWNPISQQSFPFGFVCDHVLELAKAGKVTELDQLLASDAQRQAFMALGLVHHSSDEAYGAGISGSLSLNKVIYKAGAEFVKRNEPNPDMADGYYIRKEHKCEKESKSDAMEEYLKQNRNQKR